MLYIKWKSYLGITILFETLWCMIWMFNKKSQNISISEYPNWGWRKYKQKLSFSCNLKICYTQIIFVFFFHFYICNKYFQFSCSLQIISYIEENAADVFSLFDMSSISDDTFSAILSSNLQVNVIFFILFLEFCYDNFHTLILNI